LALYDPALILTYRLCPRSEPPGFSNPGFVLYFMDREQRDQPVKDQYSPIYLGAPGEEISIRELRAIKLRFKRLHQMRMQRVHDFLQPRQQIFLDLLPLIFHGNYPLLPGFISSQTPAGLSEYSPGTRTLKAARKFIKDFSYNARSVPKPTLEGLFLMGSVGSIAFSKTSDMDIWLCHHPELLPDEIVELEKKAHAVEHWAATLGLEVHFFLMNSKQFRLGLDIPISSESSGETQHYLLLEEFYRTSIYVAGKSLAWWLVPPHQEHNYAGYLNHLETRRFIKENELIDFGGLNAVPAEEFISATLWHIYKSLQSPHKSLLKLLLMECYASEYPNPKWLCLEIKQAIYQGNFTTSGLDPYLLIYLKVESYLQQAHSLDRLVLARQNFFLKITDSTDEAMNEETLARRQCILTDVAERCHWPPGALEDMKRRRFWDIKKAVSEHAIILQQLNHCFRMIMGFAGDHVEQYYRDSNDLKLIGRKLSSFLEKKPGKIEIITTRTAVNNRGQELSIVENRYNDDKKGWSLFVKNTQIAGSEDWEQIVKCRTLIEMLGWLVINGFYQPERHLQLKAQSLGITNEELQRVLHHLELFFKSHFSWETSLINYQSANTLIKSLIIVNIGNAFQNDPTNALCLISEYSDILSYGIGQKCLIQTVDRISISSWSEIISHRHEGIEGFFDCLIAIINDTKKPLSSNDLTIVCHTPLLARSIIQRIESVFGTLAGLFSKIQPDSAPRYILPGGRAYFVFQSMNKVLSYKVLETDDKILSELARPQEHFSQVYFDKTILINDPIPLIYSLNRPGAIQVFYFERKSIIMIYILDERGTLYSQKYAQSTPSQLLSQYSIFLESILNRNFIETFITIEYYEIRKNSEGTLSCHSINLKTPATSKALNLRITGIAGENNLSYTIYCNEREFSSLDHGNQVFQAVYQHIVQFRESKIDYPVYISDIDLPISVFGINSNDLLQTIHYLNLKQKIEDKLNSKGANQTNKRTLSD
jgi:adenylate cyclase class 1